MSFVGFPPPLQKDSKPRRKEDRPIGFSEPLRKEQPKERDERPIGFSAPLKNETKPKQHTLPKRKIDYAYRGKFIQEAIDANLADMKALIQEFHNEFPLIKGMRGYALYGHDCADKDKNCDKCPHSLNWGRYDYRKKNKFGNYEEPKITFSERGLSAHFKQSRSPRVVERFLYYDGRRKVLNAQRKKLSQSMAQMRGAYQRIERSKVFKEDE